MLVEQDVAKWGESEREASRRMHSTRTYGLALNTLRVRARDTGTPDPELEAAANKALTRVDRAELRKGG